MIMNENEQLKAAYALNLCTVSVSQIVDYNDLNILEQEYDTIMNNLNLENMPKDEALLEVIKKIMDEITYSRMDAGDKKIMEKKYQRQLKNAIWSAVPNVGAIFATSDPIAMGVALATQVGIGYMNYRRNRAEYELEYEESKWQISKNRMEHFNGLQKELFETAWRLSKAYEFPNRYRLTEKEIPMYNEALMEANPVKRYNKLNAMKSEFEAYPVFWYQLGSTANSIFRSKLYNSKSKVKSKYKAAAIENFEKYYQLNKFNLLKHDLLTASWALEYLELLDLNRNNGSDRAKELIEIAEQYAGNAWDVIELCAFAYLRIGDYDNAIREFHKLVNNSYNVSINTQILSGLYIKQIYEGNPRQREEAQIGYDELPNIITDKKYILPLPQKGTDLSKWKPEWNREESIDDFIEKQKEEQYQKKEEQEELKKKARLFYQKPILLVYSLEDENVAEYFKGEMDKNREKLGDYRLPSVGKMELKEYIKQSSKFEQDGTHIIMIGDSQEAKKLYKLYLKIKDERWDYYNLGMRYITYGNKTILLVRSLKDEQIDDLLHLAASIKERQPMIIPEGIKSVYYTVLKDCYQKQGLFEKQEELLTDILAAMGTLPSAALAQAKELVENGMQWGKNLGASKELRFLQYCVAIYKYLESENAIVD